MKILNIHAWLCNCMVSVRWMFSVVHFYPRKSGMLIRGCSNFFACNAEVSRVRGPGVGGREGEGGGGRK